MEFLLPIATVAGITTLAVLSPGPNFVVISKMSLVDSRRAGVFAALGVVAGNAIHVLAGLLGLTAVVAQSDQIYNIIRFLGAAYLLYMGATLLLATRSQTDEMAVAGHRRPQEGKKSRAFRAGLLTMMTNPSAAVFYLAIFTTVVPPAAPPALRIVAALTILLITLVWHPMLAWFFSNRHFQRFYVTSDKWINIIFSLLLLGLAIRIVVS